MKKLLIVKLGKTFDRIHERFGGFDDMAIRGLGLKRDACAVVKPYEDEPLPDPGRLSGVLITGSHDMITDDLEWSSRCAAWIPYIVQAKIPMLGICYGHQLIAQAMGGRAGNNPCGLELGSVDVQFNRAALSDRLFGGELSATPQKLYLSHAQSVLTPPAGAELLASSKKDDCQAFSINGHVWGVQFHPEFSREIVCAYISEFSERLLREGQDPDALIQSVIDSSYGDRLLRRFGEIVSQA